MRRNRTQFLFEWFESANRKPLIIRGARQVGKTWLIRDFAQLQNLRLIELNFEKRPDLESLFAPNDPREVLLNLQALTQDEIDPSTSILFLDEIQAAPQLLAKLRWFAEDLPEFPVIAAGSLLEFTLSAHEFSMPVGRISYMHLEPLSFEEFLDALGNQGLKKYVEHYNWDVTIPKAIHDQLMQEVKEYMLIGGMPAAVATWVETRNPMKVNQVHFDLLATYRDDFTKYHGRLSVERLEEVMTAVPRQLGNKFVYSKVNADVQAAPLKQGFDLLTKARVCHRITSTAANGLPLGAEANERYTKALLLDCGLCSASLGLTIQQLQSITELVLVNNGGMAEQVVGQLLRTTLPPFVSPMLYYWQREKRGTNAEVDYVWQCENRIIPIEVKAGSTGTLKSLHQFMKEKKGEYGVRVNSDYPSKAHIQAKDAVGASIEYTLFSIPFYLVEQLHRLIQN